MISHPFPTPMISVPQCDAEVLARCDRSNYRVHKTRVGTFTVLRYSPDEADEVSVKGCDTPAQATVIINVETRAARRLFAELYGRQWTQADARPR
jgi:transposase-like protein